MNVLWVFLDSLSDANVLSLSNMLDSSWECVSPESYHKIEIRMLESTGVLSLDHHEMRLLT